MHISEVLTACHLPRLDAEILLSHVLGKTRTWVIAHEHDALSQESIDAFAKLALRRRAGEPVAYITGSKEFYGRAFLVTPAVLIPRPATEGLIDLTKDFLQNPKNEERDIDTEIVSISRVLSDKTPVVILDIGTGSGCIAVTLALEGVAQKIIAVDISETAIEVARKNAEKYGVEKKVTFLHANGGDIITSMKEPFLIVSNPPYIPTNTTLEKTVNDYEPHSALFAGRDGLDVIESLVVTAEINSYCTGTILECRADQVQPINAILYS